MQLIAGRTGQEYNRANDATAHSGKTEGKRKGSGNAKNGNKYLAWAFVEAAKLCDPL